MSPCDPWLLALIASGAGIWALLITAYATRRAVRAVGMITRYQAALDALPPSARRVALIEADPEGFVTFVREQGRLP